MFEIINVVVFVRPDEEQLSSFDKLSRAIFKE